MANKNIKEEIKLNVFNFLIFFGRQAKFTLSLKQKQDFCTNILTFWGFNILDCWDYYRKSQKDAVGLPYALARALALGGPTASSNRFKTNPIRRKINFCMISLH